MAENYEYNSLLSEMLDLVPDDTDKREGSVIYDTLSPTAFMIAQQNYMLGYMFDLLFADTAEGEWLDRVVNDFGINREQATYALRQINTFDKNDTAIDVPLNSRFAINDVTFKITEKITTGQFKATCEQLGTSGNLYSGTILPVDNINGLANATLITEPLIPARDEETDESLRARFYEAVRQTPYGGNIADYEQKTLAVDGVGAVKVFTAVSQGAGNVGIVIGDEQGNKATAELISKVQTLMGTDGDGIAPIGHTVTVKTSVDLTVNVSAEIKIKTGSSFDVIKPIVESTITNYIENIGFTEETVFYAKLVADILNCHESIIDVGTVTMNGSSSNLILTKTYATYQVPTVGTIAVTEVAV
ncbi:baseplate J/gp47 family protein [Youxingia wuxianensis]|uniref:Baseplate J/gp47 family protein n=1 Tax=Youxingia wuxianensis TaxID=2763678 RepID=A0A926IJC8_9FIRM|nr:baseplate J/gp47 family protein [Youxingia wuxianensis]MBC8586558.1 baseplate J/gp47 family protein [Youxingia wuxianensis]